MKKLRVPFFALISGLLATLAVPDEFQNGVVWLDCSTTFIYGDGTSETRDRIAVADPANSRWGIYIKHKDSSSEILWFKATFGPTQVTFVDDLQQTNTIDRQSLIYSAPHTHGQCHKIAEPR
jgi:hypothetical protein